MPSRRTSSFAALEKHGEKVQTWFRAASPPDQLDHFLCEGPVRAIRVAREERGLRRADLAEQAGISYTHLAEVENGKKNPSPSALRAVAAVLEVRPFELMALADALGEERGSITRAAIRERVTREAPAMLEPPDRIEGEMRVFPAAAASPSRGERMSLLDQLLASAKDLPPEDLQQLVDLARRLRQR